MEEVVDDSVADRFQLFFCVILMDTKCVDLGDPLWPTIRVSKAAHRRTGVAFKLKVAERKNPRVGPKKAPPTESQMAEMVASLERQLNDREKKVREQSLKEIRRFLRAAASAGGVAAPISKSFLKRGSKDIRVDLEVIAGLACVPDSEPNN